MPCRMDDMPDTSKDDQIRELKKQGDEAFRHLCTLLSRLEERELYEDELPSEIKKWWKHHKKVDEKRIKREKIEADIKRLQQELSKL